jgi:hypothetical protein
MTTSLPHTHVRLRDLSELVAGIPYVLGFPPTDSLVLFTFRRCPILTLSTTIRVDLPKQEHVSPVVSELSAAAARNEAVAAIAVVVGEEAPEHRELVQDLRKTLADYDILLTHASWVRKVVHGEQWQCYDDPLCTGAVPDPQTSALAAAIAVAGDTTYPDREAVAAHLAPDPAEALARRKRLLDAYRTEQPQPYGEQQLEADLRTLGHALDMALSSYDPPSLNDHQLVRLAKAMSQAPIRDECLAIALTDEPEPTERLWTALVRSLPVPERAEPAVLLAVSAYLRGAGVLAALALKIALDSNPHHRTALLLDYALQMGMPPTRLKSMLRTCTVNNEEEQNTPVSTEDDPPWETTAEPPNPTTPPKPQAPENESVPENPSAPEDSPVLENRPVLENPPALENPPTPPKNPPAIENRLAPEIPLAPGILPAPETPLASGNLPVPETPLAPRNPSTPENPTTHPTRNLTHIPTATRDTTNANPPTTNAAPHNNPNPTASQPAQTTPKESTTSAPEPSHTREHHIQPTSPAPNPPTTEDPTAQQATFPETRRPGNTPNAPTPDQASTAEVADPPPTDEQAKPTDDSSASPTPGDSIPPSAEDEPIDPGPVVRANPSEPPSDTIDTSDPAQVGGSAPPSRPAVPPPDDDPLDDLGSMFRRRAVGKELADSCLTADDSSVPRSASGSPTEAHPTPSEPSPRTAATDVLTAEPRMAPGALSQRTAAALGIPVRNTTVLNALTAFLPPPCTESQSADRLPTDRSEPG